MALVFYDLVKEITTTGGTGTFTLGGAVSGYRSFSVVGNGNTCYYAARGALDDSEWEVGLGTYASSGTTLARTTVLASSNSGSAVNFTGTGLTIQLVAPASLFTALAPLASSTTVGTAFVTLTNPGAITFPRINADNSVSALSASDFRTAIGAGTSSFGGAFSDLTGNVNTFPARASSGSAGAKTISDFGLSLVAAADDQAAVAALNAVSLAGVQTLENKTFGSDTSFGGFEVSGVGSLKFQADPADADIGSIYLDSTGSLLRFVDLSDVTKTIATTDVVPAASPLKQRVYTMTTSSSSGSTTIPYDNTLPQSGEGTQIMSVAITPQSTSNKIFARATIPVTGSSGGAVIVALFRDTTCVNAAVWVPDPQAWDSTNAGLGSPSTLTGTITVEYAETATGTSSQTWSVRIGAADAGGSAAGYSGFTWAVGNGANGTGSSALFGTGVPAPMLVIEECA